MRFFKKDFLLVTACCLFSANNNAVFALIKPFINTFFIMKVNFVIFASFILTKNVLFTLKYEKEIVNFVHIFCNSDFRL